MIARLSTTFLASLLVAQLAAPGAVGAPPAKPNIVVILADDLSYGDMSCFGQKQFSTPNIDRLAAEGRVFANAYAGGPWCAPSRTALLTGMNGAHFLPRTKEADERGRQFNPTVAEMLKTAGYTTCALGKWHMAEGGDSWLKQKTWAVQRAATNWRQMPWHRGFDVCRIGYRCGFMGSNGNPYFPFQIETGDNQEIPLPQNRNLDPDRLWRYVADHYDEKGRFVDKAGKDSSQMRYAEDYYREEAVAFLRANRERPFFLYYATPLVHGPLVVKQLAQFPDTTGWSLPHKLWATMVQELDRSVGVIVDEVKQLGLDKHTIILFASDNGYAQWGYFKRPAWQDDPIFHNKGPWNRGKFITTNGGVIVPFIAWGPGRVSAGKTGRAINFYDFMATAGELAGAKLPGPTDGVSFVPLLEGRDRDQPLRNAMIWPHSTGTFRLNDDWNPSAKPGKEPAFPCPNAVLLDEKWYAILLGKTVRLFDIAADPGMKHDLSAECQDLCGRATLEFQNLETQRKRQP